jgi:chitinase
MVCYFTNWAQYRTTDAKLFNEKVDPKLCTHLIYSSNIDYSEHLRSPKEWNDQEM